MEIESSEESCSSDSDEYERVVRLDPRKNRMPSRRKDNWSRSISSGDDEEMEFIRDYENYNIQV